MRYRGTKVRIAQTAEDTKCGVIWHLVIEPMIGNVIVDGRGGAPVEQNDGGCQSFCPIGVMHGGMDEGAKCSVQGAQHAFGLAILSGGVRARGAE